MLFKLGTGSTSQARHESWKKRQFAAPHNGEKRGQKRVAEPAAKPAEETEETGNGLSETEA